MPNKVESVGTAEPGGIASELTLQSVDAKSHVPGGEIYEQKRMGILLFVLIKGYTASSRWRGPGTRREATKPMV